MATDTSAMTSGFAPPPSLVDETVRVLTERIVRGQFPPGMRLVEEQLAREFGISRIPIRESFRILEREGLVANRPRRGVCVRGTTPSEVREIYLCRAVLAGLAARLTAQQMTAALLAELRASMARLQGHAADGDVAAYHAEIGVYHALVVDGSHAEQVERMLQSLAMRVRRLSYTSLSLPGRMHASLEYHHQLTAAFEAGDAAAAERYSRELLEDAIGPLMQFMESHPADGGIDD